MPSPMYKAALPRVPPLAVAKESDVADSAADMSVAPSGTRSRSAVSAARSSGPFGAANRSINGIVLRSTAYKRT